MKTFIGGHEAVTPDDFAELALGTPLELWLGELGESEEERAARLDAARDILADDPGLPDRLAQLAQGALLPHLAELTNVMPLRSVSGRRWRAGKAVA